MATSRIKGTNEVISTFDSAGGKDYTLASTWESDTDETLTSGYTQVTVSGVSATRYKMAETINFSGSGAAGVFWGQNLDRTKMYYKVTSGTPGVGNTITGATSGATSTLSSIDNSNTGVSFVLECYKGVHTSKKSNISGGTTSSTYFRIIRAASGEGHSGIPKTDGSCVYFYDTSGASNAHFNGNENYFTVQDIVARFVLSNTTWTLNFYYEGTSPKIIGCIAIDDANPGSGVNASFGTWWATTSSFVINCLGIRSEDDTFKAGNATNSYIYNCSAINGNLYGFLRTSSNVHVKNCWGNTSGNDYQGTFATGTTCGSADATSPSGTDFQNKTQTYVNSGADDFHLASGSWGIDAGTDLSGDSAFAFDDDINDGAMGGSKAGQQRTGTWDIGFDEFKVSTLTINVHDCFQNKACLV